MDNIFISYRRADTGDIAGRIDDVLFRSFGRHKVFKDVDSIPLGTNFRSIIDDAIRQCGIMLVIIGRDWLTATDASGHTRLSDPNDFVRIEIEEALRRQIAIIPILVQGTKIPPRAALPASIAALVDYQAFEIHGDPYFHSDMEHLKQNLARIPPRPPPASAPRMPPPAAAPRPNPPPAPQPTFAKSLDAARPVPHQRTSRIQVWGGTALTVAIITVLIFVIVNRNSGNTGNTGNSSSNNTVSNGRNCKNIGVLLPESATSSRWNNIDQPMLQSEITAALPGVKINFKNAGGDANTQLAQAETDLTNGDCILVVAPHDSTQAASIVQAAKAVHVPVIAYDRLINDADLNFYVTFDATKVGAAQGNYIAAHYQKYVSQNGTNNIVLINGSSDDPNAVLFSKGAHNILDPLIQSGKLKSVYEQFTPGWVNATAQTEMEGALTANSNNIQIAYVANDDMAGTVIAALADQHLNGKVLVTGQDATTDGLTQILLGNQAMTVYKPIIKEAQATAQLVAAISKGTDTHSIASTTITNGTASTPADLLDVTTVDLSNIASTVLADGYVTKSAICIGVPAGTDGIC